MVAPGEHEKLAELGTARLAERLSDPKSILPVLKTELSGKDASSGFFKTLQDLVALIEAGINASNRDQALTLLGELDANFGAAGAPLEVILTYGKLNVGALRPLREYLQNIPVESPPAPVEPPKKKLSEEKIVVDFIEERGLVEKAEADSPIWDKPPQDIVSKLNVHVRDIQGMLSIYTARAVGDPIEIHGAVSEVEKLLLTEQQAEDLVLERWKVHIGQKPEVLRLEQILTIHIPGPANTTDQLNELDASLVALHSSDEIKKLSGVFHAYIQKEYFEKAGGTDGRGGKKAELLNHWELWIVQAPQYGATVLEKIHTDIDPITEETVSQALIDVQQNYLDNNVRTYSDTSPVVSRADQKRIWKEKVVDVFEQKVASLKSLLEVKVRSVDNESVRKTNLAKAIEDTETELYDILGWGVSSGTPLQNLVTELKTKRVKDIRDKYAKTPEDHARLDELQKDVSLAVNLHSTEVMMKNSVGAKQPNIKNLPDSPDAIDLNPGNIQQILINSRLFNGARRTIQAEVLNDNYEFEARTIETTDNGDICRLLDRALSGRQNIYFASGDQLTVKNFAVRFGDIPKLISKEMSKMGREVSEKNARAALVFYQHVVLGQSYASRDPEVFSGLSDDLQKMIRMIDYSAYYIGEGNFEGCADFIILLTQLADSDGNFFENHARDYYVEHILSQVHDKHLKKVAAEILAPLTRQTPEYSTVLDASGAQVAVWSPLKSFPAPLDVLSFGHFIVDGEEGIKKTASQILMKTEYGEEIYYEGIPWGEEDAVPATFLGNYYCVTVANTIGGFFDVVMKSPPEKILGSMKDDTIFSTWNKLFGYAAPLFMSLRNLSSKEVKAEYLPKLRAKFVFAYLFWGIRRKKIKYDGKDGAVAIINNVMAIPVKGEDGEQGFFITKEEGEAMKQMLEEPVDEMFEEVVGAVGRSLHTPGLKGGH